MYYTHYYQPPSVIHSDMVYDPEYTTGFYQREPQTLWSVISSSECYIWTQTDKISDYVTSMLFFTVCRSYTSHCVSKSVMSFCLLNDYWLTDWLVLFLQQAHETVRLNWNKPMTQEDLSQELAVGARLCSLCQHVCQVLSIGMQCHQLVLVLDLLYQTLRQMVLVGDDGRLATTDSASQRHYWQWHCTASITRTMALPLGIQCSFSVRHFRVFTVT